MNTHELISSAGAEPRARSNGLTGLTGLRWLRAAGWLVYALAVVVGAVYGYRFGLTLSGMPFGLLTAALAALFCSILADAAIGRLTRPK